MLDFPLSSADFRARYFERAPLLSKAIARRCIWQLRDVDRLLEVIEPQDRSFQLFNQGLVPQHTYTHDAVEVGLPRRRLDKAPFYAQLRSGATLVINRVETNSLECRRLCGEVARFADLQTTSNVYLSFTGSGTFGKHWDTHDVFAIQLLGRKRWLAYAPTFPLPLSHHTSESFSQQEIGPAQLDLVMEPGDVLYLPRGWWHQVIPLAEPSLHLSVGTYAATMHDYFMWLSARFLSQQPSARRAFMPESPPTSAVREMFEQLRDAALDPNALRQFQHEIERRERHASDFDVESHIVNLGLVPGGSTTVRLAANTTFGDRSHVLVNGQVLQLDPLSAQIVGVLREGATMALDALCKRIAGAPASAVGSALLALAERDIVSIER